MSVPEFQAFMLPLLRFAGDGAMRTLAEAREALASSMQITIEDRKELLPSGGQTRFDNRVTWARTYLTKAGLLERTGRGSFQITDRGRHVLANPPPQIDKPFLRQFGEFVKFADEWKDREAGPSDDRDVDDVDGRTPEEVLESSYKTLRETLAAELLDRMLASSPAFFERLVVDLLVAMGYGGSRADAGQAVGQSGDEGIDGIIKEDKLGLDVVYIQAKRWKNPVSRPEVQAFAGSLEGQRARKGVMITTSQFTSDAKAFVGKIEKKIVLIDGAMLAQLLIDHGIGVTTVSTYAIRRVDADYFDEEIT